MFKLNKYLCITIISFAFFSCIGDNIDTISDEYEQESTISFPVKKFEIGAQNYGDVNAFLNYYNDHQSVIISDTLNADYSDIVNDSTELKSLLYRFYIVNEFPSSLQLEIYLLDDNGQTIEIPSITHENPIAVNAPVIDESGNIISYSEQIIDLEFDEDNINTYFDVNQLLLRLNFTNLSTNQTILDKLEDYKVTLSIGVRADITVSINR